MALPLAGGLAPVFLFRFEKGYLPKRERDGGEHKQQVVDFVDDLFGSCLFTSQ